ncbi:hypothetical protein RJT34_03183 [Clitoria ternatea]|uniref:Pentatricopeptide repeat-containing protein n=1 Tax=Clitoria ternatea TaxID=43366 RepID=A0AAN9KKD1_CLITE
MPKAPKQGVRSGHHLLAPKQCHSGSKETCLNVLFINHKSREIFESVASTFTIEITGHRAFRYLVLFLYLSRNDSCSFWFSLSHLFPSLDPYLFSPVPFPYPCPYPYPYPCPYPSSLYPYPYLCLYYSSLRLSPYRSCDGVLGHGLCLYLCRDLPWSRSRRRLWTSSSSCRRRRDPRRRRVSGNSSQSCRCCSPSSSWRNPSLPPPSSPPRAVFPSIVGWPRHSGVMVGIQSSPCLRLLEGHLTLTLNMRHLKQVHAHTITHGLARFAFVSSKLLAFTALSPRGDLHYAHTIFSHIPLPNVFDYNTLITAFSRNPRYSSSSLFTKMLNDAVRPNSRTFTFLVKSCGSLSFLQQLHTHILKLGNFSDVYVVSSVVTAYSKHGAIEHARRVFDESPRKNVACWTSLVTAYCNCGLVDDARDLFDSIPMQNDVSFSAMVSGYVRNGFYSEGIEVFNELKSLESVRPNNSLLVSVLNACGAVGAFEEGKWVHSYVDGNAMEYELELGTALIDFYAKCGCVRHAEVVFDKMKNKDVTTWSAMILGLAINGKNHKALEVFEEMEKVGPKPNEVTFIGVLSACNHKDLLNEVLRLFRYMSEKYGIVASIEHYGCVVDILARSGRIEEALGFVKSMPVEPDGAIWGSLLNGCLVHGYVELGQKVGKYLIEFEPEHSGRYILLANVYASAGEWEGVFKTRKLMRERGVCVVSAWSFIEIDQTVHKFVVDDKRCLYSREIYQVLNHLGRKLEYYSKAKDSFLF